MKTGQWCDSQIGVQQQNRRNSSITVTGRCQRIKLGDCLSSKADLKFGDPQGSVLGPLLFTLYTTPLSSMISGHAILHHLSADNSQLYVSFASGDSATALNGLQSCLASVQSWMLTNKPKLNPYKTEFLLIGNEKQRSKFLSMFPIELFCVKTNPEESARNFGVIFDKNFAFRSDISAICSSYFYHMREMRCIHRHLAASDYFCRLVPGYILLLLDAVGAASASVCWAHYGNQKGVSIECVLLSLIP